MEARSVDAGLMLRMSGVKKIYGQGSEQVAALGGVDLEIPRGEFLAVVGKSGSGKSTLLNIMTGIDAPTEGELWIQGEALHALRESRRGVWRGRTVGIVFQFFQLIPTLSVLENVILPMDFCGTPERKRRRGRALELLERVGIADQAGKLPSAMSGGQQQRAAIARALATDPPFLCADEPTGNLDSENSGRILELFRSLNDDGKTVVIVSHEPELRSFARREIRIVDGRIVSDVPLVVAGRS